MVNPNGTNSRQVPKRYKYLPEDGTHIFAVGLPPDAVTCPRRTPASALCAGRLVHEPALARCWDCGALWPVRGGVLRDQREFEVSSGLIRLGEVVENIGGFRLTRARKRPLRAETSPPGGRTTYWTRGLRPAIS